VTYSLPYLFNQDKQLWLILFIWLLAGVFVGSIATLILIPATLLLLKRKNLYMEMLLGFFFILILSDSRQPELRFAAHVKDIYIVLLGLFLVLNLKDFKPINKTYQYVLPFILIAFISMQSSEKYFLSLQKTLSYLLLFLIVPNYVIASWRINKEKFLQSIIILGSVILIAGLAMKFALPGKVHFGGRFTGVLGNPNGLGVFCLMFFLLVSTIKYFYQDILTKRQFILVYGLILVSVFLSGSRSSLLAIILFVFFTYFHKKSPFLGFLILCLIILANEFITSNLPQLISFFGAEDYFRIKTLEQGSGRLVAWNFAWEHIQKNFFLGKGFDYTNYLFARNGYILSFMGHHGHAHNSFLTFWLDTGIVGLLAFCGGLIILFLKAAKRAIIAFPILYAVIFSSFFESWLTASLNPFTIQLVMIITLIFLLGETKIPDDIKTEVNE
jgi:O-antigen ligase